MKRKRYYPIHTYKPPPKKKPLIEITRKFKSNFLYKLQEILKYKKQLYNNTYNKTLKLITFAEQFKSSRRFFLATPIRFINDLKKNIEQNKPNYYHEVIEGDSGCHGYIDYEYLLEFNKEKEENEKKGVYIKIIKETIIKLLDNLFINQLGIEGFSIQSRLKWVILTSSNNKKISYHIIFKILGFHWYNNNHLGAFIRRLIYNLRQEYGNDYISSPLWVYKDLASRESDIREVSIDPAVYTKNKTIRTYGSCKPDDLSRIFKFYPGYTTNISSTLLTLIGSGSKEIIITEYDNITTPLSTNKTWHYLVTHNKIQNHPSSNKYNINKIKYLSKTVSDTNIEYKCLTVEHTKKIVGYIENYIQREHNIKDMVYFPSSGIISISTLNHKCVLKTIELLKNPELKSHLKDFKNKKIDWYFKDNFIFYNYKNDFKEEFIPIINHSHNHIFYCININFMTIYQKCYSTRSCCTGHKSISLKIKDSELIDLLESLKINRKYNSFIDFNYMFSYIK